MYVAATGMVCSVGLSARPACAAIRAGIARIGALPYRDNQGEPIVGAALPGMDPDLRSEQRLPELLALAISDVMRAAEGQRVAWQQVPLLVGVAEPSRPGIRPQALQSLLAQLESRLGTSFHPSLSQVLAHGHTAVFHGLAVARTLLTRHPIPACLVCGVDSYLSARSLLWLDEYARLKTPENSDGVIPGEAAGALLVRSGPVATPLVHVHGLGFGQEAATVLSDEPLLGQGLAQAARGALTEAGLQMHDIDYRLADVTGESYGFKEQALTLARTMRVRKEALPLRHFADTIGDVGAAAGACAIALAAYDLQAGRTSTGPVLCTTSAVPGDRAAAVVGPSPLAGGPR